MCEQIRQEAGTEEIIQFSARLPRFESTSDSPTYGSMEIMMLLLSFETFRCSRGVHYLVTARPVERSAQVKPTYVLMQKEAGNEDFDPFYKDAIGKYFERPYNDEFEVLTYVKYYSDYRLDTAKRGPVAADGKQPFKRKRPILLRTTQRRLCHGDAFFYDRLLHQHHWRSEDEMRGTMVDGEPFASYRDHFVTRWPTEYVRLQQWHANETEVMRVQADAAFWEASERIAPVGSGNQSQITSRRLQQMRTNVRAPPKNTAVLELEGDQLTTYNYITTQFMSRAVRGPRAATFFVTGPGGTGKSFLLFALEGWLMNHNWTFAKTAPTGIAANHIGGKTIHSSFGISQKDRSSWGSFQSCAFQ